MVCRPRPATQEQPVGADPRAVPPLQVLLHGHRLLARVLDVHLEGVLQGLADPGHGVHDARVSAGVSPARGRACTTSMPSACRSAALPTPDSWSSCGLLIAPPDS